MAVTPTAKTKLVSARELTKTLEAALNRVGGGEPGSPLILRWELVGRRAKDFATGQKLAAEITAELGNAGIKVQPAVLSVGREITCGFFEPPNVPLARNL